MRQYILALAVALAATASAQMEAPEFGVFSPEEKAISTWNQEEDLKAIVTYDKGVLEFEHIENSWYTLLERRKRVKVLNPFDEDVSQVSIILYRSGQMIEELLSIEASTFVPEGDGFREVKVAESLVFKEQINENLTRIKFVHPNVQKDAFLELTYKIRSPYIINIPNWEFQSEYPCLHSEYQVKFVPFFEYVYEAQGMTEFDFFEAEEMDKLRDLGKSSFGYAGSYGVEFKEVQYTFAMNNVDPFVDEGFITSPSDYIQKISFQLSKIHRTDGSERDFISTWPELNEAMLDSENFGKFLKVSQKLSKKLLAEIDIENKSDLEKIQAISELMKATFTWNGKKRKYADKTAKDVYNDREGNSAELNMFAISMIREADIECTPIILSTRSHGKLRPDYPFDNRTNYVIGMAKAGGPVLVDVTDKMLAFDKIPTDCINERALAVDFGGDENWIGINLSRPSVSNTNLAIDIDDEKTFNIQLSGQYASYAGYDLRTKFRDDPDQIKRGYEDRLGEIDSVMTYHYDSPHKPYIVNLLSTKKGNFAGDYIFLNPFLDFGWNENPFEQETRNYPVDFVYPVDKTIRVSVGAPDNYVLSETPENFIIDDDLVFAQFEYNPMGKGVIAQARYYFKKSIYSIEEYGTLKKHSEDLVKAFTSKIVFEKAAEE